MSSNLELKEQLRDIIAEVGEIDEVPEETSFRDLGIDSMMAVEIVADIERTFGIRVPEEKLETLTNFAAVLELVEQHTNRPSSAPPAAA